MLALVKRLEVGGAALPVVDDRVTLELGAVGRGVFYLRGDQSDTQIGPVRFVVSRPGQNLAVPVLYGLTAESARAEDGSWRVVVREPAAALELPSDFAVRHPLPADVLQAIEQRTGLEFLLPAGAPYLAERLPYFYAQETCRQALEAMGPAWGMADAVWAGLPDGRVWWGRWADSPFAGEAFTLDRRLVLERDPEARALVLPYLPRLRPGVLVTTEGAPTFIIRRVTHAGEHTRIEWGEV